ncbi:MAG TPA: DUF3800 domain-containing protein [Candidatus Angelobacter sp.]|nr:DUF3800 domain-containing protein [Candidatus Angelobacter sp.]
MTDYAAYFDDSGHPDNQEAVIAAGFVASREQWQEFEREWKEVLDHAGLDHLHMRVFQHSKDLPFHQKEAILRRLVKIIERNTIRPIAHIVLMKEYAAVNEKYAMEEVLGAPYAIAGRSVARSLNLWRVANMAPSDTFSVYFEDGSKHKGDFIDAMQRDQLEPPTFVKNKDVIAFQAADLFAWEMLYAIRHNLLSDGHALRPEFKKLVRGIQPNDPHIGVYYEKDLINACEKAPAPLRESLQPNTVFAHHSSPKKLRKRTIK